MVENSETTANKIQGFKPKNGGEGIAPRRLNKTAREAILSQSTTITTAIAQQPPRGHQAAVHVVVAVVTHGQKAQVLQATSPWQKAQAPQAIAMRRIPKMPNKLPMPHIINNRVFITNGP